MKPQAATPAALEQPSPDTVVLRGCWTARGLGGVQQQLGALQPAPARTLTLDAAQLLALDTTGAWVLQQWLLPLQKQGRQITWQGLQDAPKALLDTIAEELGDPQAPPPAPPKDGPLTRIGRGAVDVWQQTVALLAFVGECAVALWKVVRQPSRLRVRPVLFNIRTAGFDALPIVGLLSFLLGVVVAYQGAAQLKQYGANIFVADLVGVSMLREFAPLITAIILAGRSGSAYAAQIGTMAVTEEIDAMRTLGIVPQEMLVLPKIIALAIATPLLIVFADLMGVLGGMVMAQTQLGVGFGDFLDRFVKAVSVSTYMVGIGKGPVFAFIIAIIGCFQGFRTHGGADSVGRQTTRAVVQSIFFVIVADAMFSIAFNVLDI